MPKTARHWYFNQRPKGEMDDQTLALREEALPALQDKEFLVRSIYLSMDATHRLWIGDLDLYMEPIPVGERMKGFLIGEVVESKHDGYQAGDLVTGLGCWSDYIIDDGSAFQKMPPIPGLSIADAFGILTVAGPTALVGLMEIGDPKPGDTVVVSAAAGAVGMLVGQIAKIHGCRTIGIAGGAEKCERLKSLFGYDEVVDYKKGDVVGQLRTLAPDGIDVLFENVGGDILDAGLTVMKDFGRVVICGLISSYNADGPVPGPYMFRNVIMRRLTIRGFVILDYLDRYPEFQAKLADWMREGRLNYRLHVVDGLENAVDALQLLYHGGNHGKVMVKIGAEPAAH
ncbi:MAG: NADP-dependent oxidoreductase [Algiphilus sp.]|uniref:NADP-dependent oxidoreductase n=1 Tax=Algiphilus sp. TaxID=1872431 RepID=UPI0032EBFE2A